MRRKAINVLIAFAIANIVGILVFYGWVVSQQLKRHNPRHPRRASDFVFHSGPDAKLSDSGLVKQFDINRNVFHADHTSKPFQSNNKILTGHTLKPLKKQPQSQMGIQPVPPYSMTDHIAPIDDVSLKKHQAYTLKPTNDSILILTPIHNVAGKLKVFLRLLQSITYPHHLISIAFGEDSSEDNTLHEADNIAEQLRKSFSKVDVFHLALQGQVNGSWSAVHNKNNQFRRRKHLAQARNMLMRSSLKNHDWVLWIDSDISFLPPDIVQQLLSAEKDIVVPLCIYMDHDKKRVFDKNTWRETVDSLAAQKNLEPDVLVVEGYDNTRRLWLSDLRAEGRVVPLDGVGGCTLLVHSKCHKNGLIFPENVFQHHIETEGLAKMAKLMGYGVYGMPFVEVIH